MNETSASVTSSRIREMIVAGTMEAVNAAVIENQIDPGKIISIAFEPAKEMAIGDHEAKYRLIYRT